MRALLLFALTVPLFSQQWNLGVGVVSGFLPDPCSGGSPIVPAANAAAVATYTGEYQTFRYGTFTCTIPANGPGTLVVETIEPTVTAIGLRTFTLTIDGVVAPTPIDIFQQCGANTACVYSNHVGAASGGPAFFPAPTGVLTVTFTTVVRNSLVSALKWTPDPAPPAQIAGTSVYMVDPKTGAKTLIGTRGEIDITPGVGILVVGSDTGSAIQLQWLIDSAVYPLANVWDCVGVTSLPGVTPVKDCTGMLYVEIVGVLKVVGAAPDPTFTLDPTHWTQRMVVTATVAQ